MKKIKYIMQLFFATCMVICWVTADLQQLSGPFAIALAITSIGAGGKDD